MTVKELIEYLKAYPEISDMQVAYRLYSEHTLLNKEDIKIKNLSCARPDGWIQDQRTDMPTETYLVFPGN